MTTAGLSYQQAPPFGVPLRLFLAAAGFLLLTALAGLVSFADWPTSRWSPATLALTHLIALGYLGMVMVGALLQLLPVLLGIAVPAVRLIAGVTGAGLALGTLLLASGLWRGQALLLDLAVAGLALGFVPFLGGVAWVLVRARGLAWVVWPLRQAWLALVVTLSLGGLLAGGLSGLWPIADPLALTDLHLAWGLGGWILLLVIGVAYQVVPMLQFTPAYPAQLSRWLTWALLSGLVGHSVAAGRAPAWGQLALLPALVAALVFAGVTLDLQRRRRRKLADTTLDFWRLGMVVLILATAAVPLLPRLPDPARTSLGIAFLLGFAASVVNGMLYKIVPFLAWFHLQAQTGARAGTIPNMKDMITEPAARWHFRLHLAAVLLLLPAPFAPAPAALPGLLLLVASALLLGRNLLRARHLFLVHGGRL